MHGTVAMPSTAEIRSVLWPVKNMPSKSEVRTALLVCCLRQMKYTVYLRSVPSKTKMCTVHWSMHSSKISWNIQCTYNQCLPQLKYAMYFCQYLPHLKSMQCSLVNAVHSWNMQCILVTAFHNWNMRCTLVSAVHDWNVPCTSVNAFHIWKVCSVLWSVPSATEKYSVYLYRMLPYPTAIYIPYDAYILQCAAFPSWILVLFCISRWTFTRKENNKPELQTPSIGWLQHHRVQESDDWSVTRTNVSNYQQYCGLRCVWQYNKNELNVHGFVAVHSNWKQLRQKMVWDSATSCGCTLWHFRMNVLRVLSVLRVVSGTSQKHCSLSSSQTTKPFRWKVYYVNVAFLSALVRFDTSGTCFCWSRFRDWFQCILRLRKTVCSFISKLDNAIFYYYFFD